MTDLIGTYRVQLRPGFGFDEAASIADYLASLGVSHLYASPYLQAARGSTHGYDVVDYGWVNAELGGSDAHLRMTTALRDNGLGHVLDLVPNHMATGPENSWWWDVLQNGPSSRYAAYFDIDWHGPESRLRNKVLLPILGDHYGRVLEAGKIRLQRGGAVFQVTAPGQVTPVTPDSLDRLLQLAAWRAGSEELESISAALGRLPPGTVTDPESVRERERDAGVVLGALARLLDDRPDIAAAVDASVAFVNSDPDSLDVFLDRQNYRLAYWRTAGRDLPYRRFFDINTLVGLNMEREDVFATTHSLVLRWVAEGLADGLRIDHPDGLRDPEGYLDRIRARAPGTWVVVEKILQPGEELPKDWPVAGTTGYDFLNRTNGLFVDPAAEEPLTDLYQELTGETREFSEIAAAARHQVMSSVLASDLNRLTELAVQIVELHRRYRDYTRHELHEALREFLACLPVYRSYVDADRGRVAPEDVAIVAAAVDAGKRRRPDLDPELFDFLARLMTLDLRGQLETELVMRLQQISAAVMAKGVEDTAFYRYHRLVSLNEVGGAPERFGTGLEEFHRVNADVAATRPATMLTLATHDTKRGADVRARINLLTEVPERWGEAVRAWVKANDRHRSGGWPDHNIEYLLYQTLVGAWPINEDRVVAYMEKASREAKEHTSWTDPNPGYDEALGSFVRGALRDEAFRRDLAAFVEPLQPAGWANGLSQVALLLTSPGVPDLYQGTELWDMSLVDPDNRRFVDYDLRRARLEATRRTASGRLWQQAPGGLAKVAVVRAGLSVRRRHPEAFAGRGDYLRVETSGPAADHVVAFSRGGRAVTVALRRTIGIIGPDREHWTLADPARTTTVSLPPGRWVDEITRREHKGTVDLGTLLADLPVALLTAAS